VSREVLIHVRRGDEFLVAHRSPAGGSYWHAIAGGVEPGEEWEAAARRELHEETGLTAGALEPLGEFSYTPEAWELELPRRRIGVSVHVQAFLVDAAPGWEPELDHEHDDYRWLPREEAIALLFWPEPAALLRALP
jgi:8-oxo-dGTP pyrophosphatase MutT (NUDIX family)